MSKVDLKVLKEHAAGNPRDKVMVTKGYLTALAREIEELRKRPREEQMTPAQEKAFDQGMRDVDKGMDATFSAMDQMFNGIFGKDGFGSVVRKSVRATRSKK